MAPPSIIPSDRLDSDFYIVLEDFKSGAAFREMDEGSDYQSLIRDLLSGEYDQVLRVVAFNPIERWSRAVSEHIARQLERHISGQGYQVSEALREFIEDQIGHATEPAA
jgi:hypothetical protein